MLTLAGFTVGDDDNLGERQLLGFVGGRATGDYLSLNHSCQFKYIRYMFLLIISPSRLR